jgi:hypothetical protein
MGKVGMSVLVKGLGMEWEEEGKNDMTICGIWPASVREHYFVKDVGWF